MLGGWKQQSLDLPLNIPKVQKALWGRDGQNRPTEHWAGETALLCGPERVRLECVMVSTHLCPVGHHVAVGRWRVAWCHKVTIMSLQMVPFL